MPFQLLYDTRPGWQKTTFPSHDEVICLNCKTPLGSVEVEPADAKLGCGWWRKRCPKCQLATSYDVSPAEASEIELEEPDWRIRFEEHCARYPKLPRYLQEDSAFEATLQDWRKWHGKASALEGMIALAKLKIFPARFHGHEIPRDGKCFEEQHDDHMWVTLSQRAYRIIAVDGKTMFLDSFGEKTQVELIPERWRSYIAREVEKIEEMRKNDL